MSDIKQFEPLWGVWRTEQLIGEGSYGKVYRAVREEFGTKYYSAIKHISIPVSELNINDVISEGMVSDRKSVKLYYDGIVRSLMNEISLMNKVKGNTNIVSYEDHQIIPKESGVGYDIFIRMELLTCVNELLASRSFTQEETVKLGIDLCSALEVCAEKGIVHRDIKPHNIFVNDLGQFKLGDFGVAKVIEHTATGMSKKGTYSYMAPEVYHGEMAGFSTDTYSLGLVMYRLLNGGRSPFLPANGDMITQGDNERALIRRMSGEPLPPPAYADKPLADIILKATSFNRFQRFLNATQFKDTLKMLQTQKKQSDDIIQRIVPSPKKIKNEEKSRSLFKKVPEWIKLFWKKNKKVAMGGLSVIVVLILIVVLFANKQNEPIGTIAPTQSVSDRSGNCGENIIWELNEEDTLLISGTGKMYNFDLGEFFTEEDKVTVKRWHEISKKATSIKIGDGVTEVGAYAFADCTHLESVLLPDSLMTIGESAFLNCMSLTDVRIPDSVESVGEDAFKNCTKLEHIVLSKKMRLIPNRCFENDHMLESVFVPDTVSEAGEAAFENCDAFSVYGYHGSYAEKIAEDYKGASFVDVDQAFTFSAEESNDLNGNTVVKLSASGGNKYKFYYEKNGEWVRIRDFDYGNVFIWTPPNGVGHYNLYCDIATADGAVICKIINQFYWS